MRKKPLKSKTYMREKVAMIITLIVVIVMLCIPSINKALIGILGYAVYAYAIALGIMILLLIKGYKVSLPRRKVVLYFFIFIFIVLTLHIGLTEPLTNEGFSGYIFKPFYENTPGGMIASLLTVYVVVPIGYLLSLIIFFIITSILLLVAILPIFIKKEVVNGEDNSQNIKHKLLERLSYSDRQDEEEREGYELQVLNIQGEELPPAPLTVEDYEERPRTKEDARKLLFGDAPRPKRVPLTTYWNKEVKREQKVEEELREENPYEILPNFEASLIKPKDEWYTNNFIRAKKVKEAKDLLLNTDIEEDYENRYGELGQTQPESKVEPYKINTYEPMERDRVTSNRMAARNQEVQRRSNSTSTVRQESSNTPSRPIVHKPYVPPHAGLLKDHIVEGFNPRASSEEYNKYKQVLETTLQHFGITATVFNAIKGPTVTRYELRLEQGAGNSVNKVINLHKDLKMVLEAEGEINILAPIRGKNAIGIEIPNKKRGIVSLREVVNSPEFKNDKRGIKLALGKTLEGEAFIGDLEDMPHLLVAGATGTGKSVCINAIIASILFQHSPEEVKLLLIDPKKVELINYIGLPHLLIKEPLIEISEIVTALKWIREETSQRFNKFKDMRVVNINAYNSYAKEKGLETIPKIVIVIDEASELMTTAKKEVEETLSSLARIGRAAGVHLIFATQSPTKDVITSEIQNNLNTKIAFAVSDYVHSQVIFKTVGAEKLLGKGDMFLKGSGGELTRVQCSYIDPAEIQKIVKFIIDNNEANFDEKINEDIVRKVENMQSSEMLDNKGVSQSFMDSVKEALKIGLRMKRISTSLLQRRMDKGYNGAAKIMDYLEDNGYIAEPDGSNRRREVLITVEQFLKLFPEERGNMGNIE